MAALRAEGAALEAIAQLLDLLEQQTLAAAEAAVDSIKRLAQAAQAASSFPRLAHNSLVAVSSQLMAQTPSTHLRLLALLFQPHL